jgi:phosphohistidine phosphatase SixA
MKALYYLRHSIKDTENHISAIGLQLAYRQGVALKDIAFSKIFFGELVRTRETAEALMHGLDQEISLVGPASEIGNDQLFAEMATPKFRQFTKAGYSNLDALYAAHPLSKFEEWTSMAVKAVRNVCKQMKDNEVAILIGHSPMIELAAMALAGISLPEDITRLNEIEGAMFLCENEIVATSDKKIFAPK